MESMMHEQISLGGAPVVGFGDADLSIANPMFFVPLLGVIAGAAGGALLGHKSGGVATVAGAVVGGLVGGVGGIYAVALIGHTSTTSAAPSTAPSITSASSWRRIPIADLTKLKAGQQLALGVAQPNGAAFPPKDIAAINAQFTALATAPVNLPTKNFVQYPPGSKLPTDWPADDDLGSNAYRISADLIADASFEAGLFKVSPNVGSVEIWVRDKPK